MFHTILVPIDGSEHSRVALCVACKLARQEDGRLILLHIPEALPHEPLLVWGIGAVPLESTMEKRDEVGQTLLDHAIEEARALGIEQAKPVARPRRSQPDHPGRGRGARRRHHRHGQPRARRPQGPGGGQRVAQGQPRRRVPGDHRPLTRAATGHPAV